MRPEVSVVVSNHNGARWLPALFESIDAQTLPAADVWLVDNASDDDSVALCRERFPWVHVVDGLGNLGYGGAINAGVARAKGDFLVFLNEDMRLAPDLLERLAACHDAHGEEKPAIVVAREVAYDDASVTRSRGCSMDIFGATRPNAEPGPFFYAPGAPCFMRRDVFEEIGGFDPSYFLYYEDVDLSWRTRLRGHRIVLCGESVIHHAGGGTTEGIRASRLDERLHRNRLYTLVKNYGGWTLAWLLPAFLLSSMLSGIAASLRTRRFAPLAARARTYRSLLRDRRAWLARRREVQRTRRVGDRAILGRLVPSWFGSAPFAVLNAVVRAAVSPSGAKHG